MKGWDPYRDFLAIQDDLNKLFETVLTGAVPLEAEGEGVAFWRPPGEVVDLPDRLHFAVELAGCETFDWTIDDGVLVVQGQRRRPTPSGEWTYHRLERQHGRFVRRFQLPSGLDTDRVETSLSDGVLHLEIAKSASVPAAGGTQVERAHDH